jgi:hypothetical protein
MTPLERAIALLKDKGYRDVQQPFGVASTSFSFDAVLTAERSLDLVILQDTTIGSAERLKREVVAFGRSLDIIGSRRTLTLVLVGQRLETDLIETLSQVCRVLSISPGQASGPRLRDGLAVLLPLELPDPTNVEGDWSTEVRSRIGNKDARALEAYLSATEQGEAGVRQELRRRVDRALTGLS